MQELKDKVALITGGGYGIGKEIALLYAREGMKIALAARSEGPLNETRAAVEKLGARAIAIRADVSKEADCVQMVEETVKAFGHVDILVNNAGIAGPTKRTTEMSLAEWQEVLDINLTGAWLASRAAIPAMVKQGSGNILMISSGAGRRGYPLRSPYASSKWAMIGLTQTLAGEWGSRGYPCQLHLPRRGRRRPHRARYPRAGRGDGRALRSDQERLHLDRRLATHGHGIRGRARRPIPGERSVVGRERTNDQC